MKIAKFLTLTMNMTTPSGITEVPITMSDYVKNTLNNMVSSKTRCVCIHHTVSDYTYSVRGTNYTKLNPMDVVGYIESIDWDTNEIGFEIDDVCGLEGNSKYVPDDNWGQYQAKIRAQYNLQHNKETGKVEAIPILFVGFDLVKIENTGESKND